MKKVIIYTDGASRGNPGEAGAGVVFCNGKKEIVKKSFKYLGKKTNNEAEYQALIFGLQEFKRFFGKKIAKATDIKIMSDSQLLVKQMKGEYKVLDKNLQKLFLIAWNLRLDFNTIKFKLVPREKNKEADALANQALDTNIRPKKLL